MERKLKIIISGGGTGGHIFPAISIANAIKKLMDGDVDILFVGAEGRMEMRQVPIAGYKIVGLPISGFDREHLLKNVRVAYRLMQSLQKARQVIKKIRPDVVVGVGGYASGPILEAAQLAKIPTLIQEQNSYAGLTNKFLGKHASKICVAYDNMERFFPSEKIIVTGNPIRAQLIAVPNGSDDDYSEFQLDPSKKTILILGGSLGARTINESVSSHMSLIEQSDMQFIWQTGKYYKSKIDEMLNLRGKPHNIYVTDFISNMARAYSVADLVISRAGAGSISEFAALGKAVILVPSPNVAEDHQTKNAMALVEKNAALCVKDSEARMVLIPMAINLAENEEKLKTLSCNIKRMALPHAAETIAKEVIALANTTDKK